MKKYIISWAGKINNEIYSVVIEANTTRDAVREFEALFPDRNWFAAYPYNLPF